MLWLFHDSNFPYFSSACQMSRHGRLDKAKCFTWMFPFAALTWKSKKNMDQKIRRCVRWNGNITYGNQKTWIWNVVFKLTGNSGINRIPMIIHIKSALGNAAFFFCYRLKSPRASKANAGQIAGSNLSESRVGNAFSRPVLDEKRRDKWLAGGGFFLVTLS